MTVPIVGESKKDATHYTDRPDNKETPPKDVDVVPEHTAGSEHHPARNGRGLKGIIDHAIELDDKLEELKHDVSKEAKMGHMEKAQDLDKEISEIIQERDSLPVSI